MKSLMKKVLFLICLSLPLAYAAEPIAGSKYPQNLIKLASHSLDNQSDPKAIASLQVEVNKAVIKQFSLEASKYKLSKDKYIADKKSLDNFIVDLEKNTTEESLNKMTPEDLLILSIEAGIRFQIHHSVRFPDLVKLEKVEKILNEKLMPKIELALEQRKKNSAKPVEAASVTDYDTSVNQLQRRSKNVEPKADVPEKSLKDSTR